MDSDESLVVGASTDSTVCFWDRRSGKHLGILWFWWSLLSTVRTTYNEKKRSFLDTLYHHRGSVWGLRLRRPSVVTASMDRTVAVVDAETRILLRHFVAHRNEWGGEEIRVVREGVHGGGDSPCRR